MLRALGASARSWASVKTALNAELNQALHRGLSLEEALQQLSGQWGIPLVVAVLADTFIVQFSLIAVGFLVLRRTHRVILRQTRLLLVLFNSVRVVGYLMYYIQGRQTSGDEHMLVFHLGVSEYA